MKLDFKKKHRKPLEYFLFIVLVLLYSELVFIQPTKVKKVKGNTKLLTR